MTLHYDCRSRALRSGSFAVALHRRAVLVFVSLVAVLSAPACGSPTLSAAAQQLLEDRAAAAIEEVVYVGEVTSLDSPDDGALFRYERRAHDGNISHLTRDLNGQAIVWQQVRVADDGAFAEMELIHAQLGLVAGATLDGQTVTLTTTEGNGAEDVTQISATGEVVVGPTLFQHLLRNRERLTTGITFDFLSLENRGVFQFAATRSQTPGVFRVRAVDPVVALMVPPLEVIYDDDTNQMVSYRGPVPPLRDDGQAFEGLVQYTADVPFR